MLLVLNEEQILLMNPTPDTLAIAQSYVEAGRALLTSILPGFYLFAAAVQKGDAS